MDDDILKTAREALARVAELEAALSMLLDAACKLAPYPPEVAEAVVAIVGVVRKVLAPTAPASNAPPAFDCECPFNESAREVLHLLGCEGARASVVEASEPEEQCSTYTDHLDTGVCTNCAGFAGDHPAPKTEPRTEDVVPDDELWSTVDRTALQEQVRSLKAPLAAANARAEQAEAYVAKLRLDVSGHIGTIHEQYDHIVKLQAQLAEANRTIQQKDRARDSLHKVLEDCGAQRDAAVKAKETLLVFGYGHDDCARDVERMAAERDVKSAALRECRAELATAVALLCEGGETYPAEDYEDRLVAFLTGRKP